MNKVILIGNLVKDGEIRTTEAGKQVYTNSIAVRKDFKNKDGNYDSDFFNINAWEHTAEYLKKYAGKGIRVAIEGKINTRTYEDKDKNKKYVTEIIVSSAEILSKNETKEIPEDVPTNIKSNYEDNIPISDADLPF